MRLSRCLAALMYVVALTVGCGGGSIEDLEISPATLAFGDVEVGDSESATLTISNHGRKAVQLITATISGPDSDLFSSGLALPIYLNEDGMVSLTFTFAPVETGPSTSTLTLAFDNGSGTTLNLSGTGVEPATPQPTPTATEEPTPPATPLPGDLDGDGYNPARGDCDEGDPSINPGAVEICGDGIDQDCSDVADDGPDADGDGFIGCGEGDLVDCDDASSSVYPGATETCNGIDDNCDGATDEPFDQDGDGAADMVTCPDFGTDCDDANPNTAPGLPDLCLPGDNDCDGAVDEDAGDIDGNGIPDCEDSCPIHVQPSSTPVAQADGSAGNPFPTIASGVQNRGDCGTVYVLPGDYAESVTFPVAELTLVAVQGPANTIVTATGGPAFSFVGAHTDKAILKDFTITGTGQQNGSCVYIEGGSPQITGNTFDGCSSVVAGGAVYVSDGAPNIDENDFLGNTARAGGAIFSSGLGTTVTRNIFNANEALEAGGGAVFMLDEVGGMLAGNLFQNNVAETHGGAALVEGTADLLIDINIFTGNIASGDGGAVAVKGGGDLVSQNNEFSMNQSQGEAGGGAVWLDQVNTASIKDETFDGNFSASAGAGLMMSSCQEITIQDSSFTNNTAEHEGGGIRASGTTAQMSGLTFTGNKGTTGGGMAMMSNSLLDLSGLTVVGNQSTATAGAGLWFAAGAQGELRQSFIAQNVAATNGGGIYVGDSAPTIRNNIIVGNVATQVAPLTGQGAGIYVAAAAPIIRNNTIVGNDGPGGGGGVVWSTGSDAIRMDNNIVAYNVSGDGVEAYDNTASFASNDVFGNLEANYDGWIDRPSNEYPDQTGTAGNISQDPVFVSFTDDDDWTNDDFHLATGSPCIDKGLTQSEYNDPDGTRNDMGAYGGPFGSW